ncbi:MAG: DoxX family protein [Gammaproteobacteria bacterium]
MSNLQPLGLFVGRILLALIFIGSGFGKITGFEDTAAYMASNGMPMVEVSLIAAILIELGAGLLLAVGYKARGAALAILLFLIPTTPIFHAFWAVDPDQVRMQMIQFQKNLAIMGGMLYVVFNGPGRISLDRA